MGRVRLLMLTWDAAVYDDSGMGDTLDRFQAYRREVEEMVVICRSTRGNEVKEVDGLTLYPVPDYLNPLSKLITFVGHGLKICREKKMNVVVTSDEILGLPGYLIKKFCNCKLNVNVFGIRPDDDPWNKKLKNRLYNLLSVFVLKRADLIRTDCLRDASYLSERLAVPREKLITIPIVPSAKSLNRFLQADGRATRAELFRRGERKERPLLLSVGFLIPQKNFSNLIDALKIVRESYPDFLQIIAGKGPEEERLQKAVEEAGLEGNILFAGAVSYEEMPLYYKACDLYVLSSDYEGFARVLMEASLAGKAIAATDVGAVPEIVTEGENGYIVPPKDPEKLAAAINKLLADPSLLRKMGERGKEKVLDYCGYDINLAKLTDSWKNLIP